jgi:hypothetical protein
VGSDLRARYLIFPELHCCFPDVLFIQIIKNHTLYFKEVLNNFVRSFVREAS